MYVEPVFVVGSEPCERALDLAQSRCAFLAEMNHALGDLVRLGLQNAYCLADNITLLHFGCGLLAGGSHACEGCACEVFKGHIKILIITLLHTI